MSDTKQSIVAAFVAAQADLTNPTKDKTANIKPGFSYRYADLATILDHVRPVLAKHGLAITQDVGATPEGRLALHTTILHAASGDRLVFGPLVGDMGRDWQMTGGAITYARRYALCAALGIAADDDTDAHDTGKPQAKAKPQPDPNTPMDADQFTAFADTMRGALNVNVLAEVAQKAGAMNMSDEQRAELRALYLACRDALVAGAS